MRRIFVMLVLLLTSLAACADSGVLIPKDKQAPDPRVLSLEDMTVRIVIDNGDAHVSIVQVFANHTRQIQEGNYRFSLPDEATVSDFAVWDGPVRIPAVILERKRAEAVYEQVRAQALDPGLLEMGDSDDETHAEAGFFTARIAPIPPFGTKRLELDYHERLTATDFKQLFTLPLKPDAGQGQAAGHFKLIFEFHSAHPVIDFNESSKLFPLKLTQNDAHTVLGSFEADKVQFTDDFQAGWTLSRESADTLEILTHRNPHTPLPTSGETAPLKPPPPESGFFQAQVLLGDPVQPATASAPRTYVLLFDNSLSMQWDKLERSYAALELVLRSVTPADRVNVLLFNQDVTPWQPQPVPATPDAVKQALAFVRGARLRGGTDLLQALKAGLTQSTVQRDAPAATLILLTDGNSDRGASVLPGKVSAGYAAAWKALPHPPHTDVLAVGDDAELTLLEELARRDGFLEELRSTEPYDFKLKTFLSKIVHAPVAGARLEASGQATSLVYPLDDALYPGMMARWVGQYQPGAHVSFTASFTRGNQTLSPSAKDIALPTVEPAHPQLPRLWAQARVDALLAQIDREGETAAAIEEIIRLSRRYKFVTPYTSFLAVPRSLLRPRVIRPGDPVLRVRTDPAIVSVIALFPFGLTQPLRHIGAEDTPASHPDPNRLWETRFLAPTEMKDGTYNVRLILRDTQGNVYRESKSFVIASTPPTVHLDLGRTRLHRGETLELRATANASTRTLSAHLEGAAPVPLRWNAAAHANTGLLTVPAELPIGRYTLTVTAEDVAHNLGTQEVQVDVIP